jgi:endonuclease YncB( thermonuclease family)
VTARVSTLTALLVPLLAFEQHAPPARPFQPFDGCIYKPQRWNDGDSFHVILPDRKEVVFRLYFVDTPEEERVYADRIAEQAAYFGITPDAAIQIGREASEFTKQALTKPFTISARFFAQTFANCIPQLRIEFGRRAILFACFCRNQSTKQSSWR